LLSDSITLHDWSRRDALDGPSLRRAASPERARQLPGRRGRAVRI